MTTIDNEPWFVAADVLDCLGIYRLAGVSPTIRHLSENEKRRVNRASCMDLFSGTSAGTYTIISESGLYKLVMRSDKPQAKEFQNWVTKVVLPAIRKDGGGEANRRCPAPTGPLGVELITIPGVEPHASH